MTHFSFQSLTQNLRQNETKTIAITKTNDPWQNGLLINFDKMQHSENTSETMTQKRFEFLKLFLWMFTEAQRSVGL